jgi:hypothetical protein
MAIRRETYGLPDETLQLIGAAPELDFGMQQQTGAAQFATPGVRRSDLISALRSISGSGNSGVTRFANKGNASMAALRNYRGANNPGILSMGKYVAPEVVLPGGETQTPYFRPKDLVVDNFDFQDTVIDDDIDEDVGTEIIDDGVVLDDPVVPVGTEITDDDVDDDVVVLDTVVVGTGNDTVTDGTGGTGGGTGGGNGGTGGGGTVTAGGTGIAGTGVIGSATTGTTGTSTTGTGDALRDAITAAVDGSGASIDNSAAGLDTSSSSAAVGSALTADQISQLTKPKVPNVTLEVSGGGLALDDAGSTSQTFDYPEFLSPDELKAYESWLATQGGGKPIFDETLGTMEF